MNTLTINTTTEKFVWKKKIERDIARGVKLNSFSRKAEKKRQRELSLEFSKLKSRKEERLLVRAHREEEKKKLALARESEADDLEEFEFRQSKIKTRIRLIEGRAKPIDVLSSYLDDEELCIGYDLNEPPYVVFSGLTKAQLEELYGEIRMYLRFDNAKESCVRYWVELLVVCESELAEKGRVVRSDVFSEDGALHKSIEADVQGVLTAGSYDDLVALEDQIRRRIRTEAKLVEYWEAVLKRLRILKAKAYLKEFHAKLVLQRPINHGHKQRLPEVFDSQKEGAHSPRVFHGDLTQNNMAVDPVVDIAKLEEKRSSVLKKKDELKHEFELKFENLMGAAKEGDSVFSTQVNLDSKQVQVGLEDKYKPRKPKYMNRVHIGYDWNKYNRTHYDQDNPPPKSVKGYKFNIFYPHLIDTTKTPVYCLENDGNRVDTRIIRFSAGPPYEDIGFRIVNEAWEKSPKKGFKCIFDQGILQLYFNFQRYRYKR